jgi:hypothetical protein
MKTYSRRAVVAIALLCLSFAGLMIATRSSAFAPAIHQANGQGLTVDPDTGAKRQFSLSARQTDDNFGATGTAVIHNHNFTATGGHGPYMVQVDITCMKVIGNTAYFGGWPRKTNEADPVYSDAVFFVVQDNGEPGRGHDMVSGAYFWDDEPAITGHPENCRFLPDPPVDETALGPIEAGNIQVR